MPRSFLVKRRWTEGEVLPQEYVVANFNKCLSAYMAVAASGGHSNYLQHFQLLCPFPSLYSYLGTNKPAFFQSHQPTSVKITFGMPRWWGCLGLSGIILSFFNIFQILGDKVLIA